MEKKYIIALQQSGRYSKAIVFEKNGNIIIGLKEFINTFYPKSDWIEQDPMEIWQTQKFVLENVLNDSEISFEEVAAIGITNQRETAIVWDKSTGKPIYNAISWQCQRTCQICEDLRDDGMQRYISKATGLKLDPYFSGPKIKWILDNVEGAREKAKNGELLFGTVDTWLLWKLTGGEVHATDYTNASRTMLYNIRDLKWDNKILDALEIPENMLPEVKNSSEIYGYVNLKNKHKIPIASLVGDQQSASFGECCFNLGDTKSSYKVGCHVLMNTGEDIIESKQGLITTIAVGINGKIQYALEGSIFTAGRLFFWIKDNLKMVDDIQEVEYFASQAEYNEELYIIPAFIGLGAPYWKMHLKGAMFGLTNKTDKNSIIRACLESIAYQTKDVLGRMEEESGIKLSTLKVDGEEYIQSNVLMQILSDILGIEIKRSKIRETPALGAAYLAGLAVGFWKSTEEISEITKEREEFEPKLLPDRREKLYSGWKQAVDTLLKEK